MGISEKLDNIEKAQQLLETKKNILIGDALISKDPVDILKANAIIRNIEEREQSDRKSFLIDPFQFSASFGYKDKVEGISYEMLANMARVPIVNAIIKTRINQIASFCEVQKDKYSTGFRVFKKGKENQKMTRAEEKRAREIEDFILNCGKGDSWESDDFDTFVRKIMRDSLIYDQMCFEVVRDRKGQPHSFYAVDASTVRVAESIDDDTYNAKSKKKIKGYYPSYVQIDNQSVVSEFYPWEMCFGLRNPTSSITNYGYGFSELEEMVTTITSILWGDEYNRKFFSQGSAPKGIIRVDSSVQPAKIQEFKQQWQAMTSGVYNAWKTPVLEAGKMDFVNLQTSNRDMEYGKWNEYLIKTVCSIYCIDPSEVGFYLNGGEGTSTVFESGSEHKFKNSKDKGLYPLLKFAQHRFNKFLVQQYDPEYTFNFVGLDVLTKEQELNMVVKKVGSFITLNEAREEMGYKPLQTDAAEKPLNSIYSQFVQQEEMAKQQEQMQQLQQQPQQTDNSSQDQGQLEGDQYQQDYYQQ